MATIKKFSYQDKIAVRGGSRTITGTTEVTDLVGLTIQADGETVLAKCTGVDSAGNTIDFMTDPRYNWGTIGDGKVLFVADNCYITNAQLTSGRLTVNQGE